VRFVSSSLALHNKQRKDQLCYLKDRHLEHGFKKVDDTMRVGVIIAAAGKGERMGQSIPKQFLPLGGMPILLHTLRAFDAERCAFTILPL